MLAGGEAVTDLRQQHADLFHLPHREQSVSGGVLEHHT